MSAVPAGPMIKSTQAGLLFGGAQLHRDYGDLRSFDRQCARFESEGVAVDPADGISLVYREGSFERVAELAPRKPRKRRASRIVGGQAFPSRDPSRDPSNVEGFLGSWGCRGGGSKVSLGGLVGGSSETPLGAPSETPLGAPSETPLGAPSETPLGTPPETPDEDHAKAEAHQRAPEASIDSRAAPASNEPTCIYSGPEADPPKGWLIYARALPPAPEPPPETARPVADPELLNMLMAGGLTKHEAADRLQPIRPGPVIENMVPRRCIQTHQVCDLGVSAARWIPRSGHLALIAAFDGAVRVYDFGQGGGRRRLRATYLGHTKAVRGVDWRADAQRFLSCSYDGGVCLWDPESGRMIRRFERNPHAIPLVAKFAPLDDHVFLVGQGNSQVVQYDTRADSVVQEYNRHRGAIHTITWIDCGRRFVTSSDDKTLIVWDYNIPVDIKYIAEPHMHAVPAVCAHPSGRYFACQSLDNRINVYSTKEHFKIHRSKRFHGHSVAGFACNLSLSPDGRCLCSGDGSGNLVFWDWKTTKMLKRIQEHQRVAIDVQWHPCLPSRVLSASWDGKIKVWE